MTSIGENLASVRMRMMRAAARAGRPVDAIRLVTVSKGQPVPAIREAAASGQVDFGENYLQEWQIKAAETGSTLRWHFIGALQRRKIRDLAGRVAWIHSVESEEQLKVIDQAASKSAIVQTCLIEVNSADETSKHGIRRDGLRTLLESARSLKNVKIGGLMTMGPPIDDTEGMRSYFRGLKNLLVEANRGSWYAHPMTELSMGMSHDFEVAIEEGATMIRVGTAIFGARTVAG